MQVPIHYWKDLLIGFVTTLTLLVDKKDNNYDAFIVIVDRLTKMVHYKFVKIKINVIGRGEVNIDMILSYHGLPELIMTD